MPRILFYDPALVGKGELGLCEVDSMLAEVFEILGRIPFEADEIHHTSDMAITPYAGMAGYVGQPTDYFVTMLKPARLKR